MLNHETSFFAHAYFTFKSDHDDDTIRVFQNNDDVKWSFHSVCGKNLQVNKTMMR